MTTEQQNILDLAGSDNDQNQDLALVLAKNYGRTFYKEVNLIVKTTLITADRILVEEENNKSNNFVILEELRIHKKCLARATKHFREVGTLGGEFETIVLLSKDYQRVFKLNKIDELSRSVMEFSKEI